MAEETCHSNQRSPLPGTRAVLWLLVLSWSTLAVAQPANDDTHILSALGSDQYAVRESMTRRLLAGPDLTPQRLERLYAAATLPEQRHRLLDVAKHHLLRRVVHEQFPGGQSGSIGVSLGSVNEEQTPGVRQSAIYVGQTYPGFPAFSELSPGDIILEVNGEQPGQQRGLGLVQFMVNRITQHAPGEYIELTVLRDDQTFNVKIRLVNIDALHALYQTRERPVAQAVQLRMDPDVMPAPFRQESGLHDLPLQEKYRELWLERYRQLQRAGGA